MNKQMIAISTTLIALLGGTYAMAAETAPTQPQKPTQTQTGTSPSGQQPTKPEGQTPPPVREIDFTEKCQGGGTRTTQGSWDTVSGAIDITVKTVDCKSERDTLHNGTSTLTGTMKISGANGTGMDVNLVNQITDKVTGGAHKLNDFTRACTITRVGAYDNAKNTFTGSITRTNCSEKGTLEIPPFVEHVLRPSNHADE